MLTRVFGEERAESVAQDLVLPEFDSRTPAQALEDGVAPKLVWKAIVEIEGLDPRFEYLHRINPRD